jgi:class 3 adenylate cyclase
MFWNGSTASEGLSGNGKGEMVMQNEGVPRDHRIEFRIGINLGDVIIDDHDIYGDGVNVAARLEALAEPGGVCVSRVVRDQVRDKVDFGFEDLGEQQVKNITVQYASTAFRSPKRSARKRVAAPPRNAPHRRRWRTRPAVRHLSS